MEYDFNINTAETMLLHKVISGSKAYGLATPESDTDIRGIFALPNDVVLSGYYVEQVSDLTNDVVYYELARVIKLLANNNPNIIELLFTPDDCILLSSDKIKPLLENRECFLSKKIKESICGYAYSQVIKSRGLNKKINKPVDKEKKSPIDFCHIFNKDTGYMVSANKWLRDNNKMQSLVGLSQLPNGTELYKLHYNNSSCIDGVDVFFKGIVSPNGNELLHSEIPKDYPVEAFLIFNKDVYSAYCKEYKECWDWVKLRNPNRYNDNINNKHNYDGKNLMHCVRLLDLGIDLLTGKGINIRRNDRDFMLSIKKGLLSYEEILSIVDEKMKEIESAFINTKLPDQVDGKIINETILKIRKLNC